MKQKQFAILIAILVCTSGLVAWIAQTPKPTLRFVGIREEAYHLLMVFRADNTSNRFFSYYATGWPDSHPFGRVRVQKSSKWELLPRGDGCEIGLDTVAPQSEKELLLRIQRSFKGTPLQLGVEFISGTSAEISSRSDTWTNRFLHLVHLIKNRGMEEDLTWSDTVTP